MALAVAVACLAGAAGPHAQLNVQQTLDGVQRALGRLPYYGVFDFLVFGLDHGTLTLEGFAYRPDLKHEAEATVKRVSGVDTVVNRIEVLPASWDDDRIRFATYASIYQDDFLSRYTPGGPTGARFGLMSFAQFPGMQPYGTHAVHIVVKNRRVMLLGVVTSEADRSIVGVRAKQVSGVFGVDNAVMVR